jgi:hypothetical protein
MENSAQKQSYQSCDSGYELFLSFKATEQDGQAVHESKDSLRCCVRGFMGVFLATYLLIRACSDYTCEKKCCITSGPE